MLTVRVILSKVKSFNELAWISYSFVQFESLGANQFDFRIWVFESNILVEMKVNRSQKWKWILKASVKVIVLVQREKHSASQTSSLEVFHFG